MFKLSDHRSMDIRGLKKHTLLQPSQLLLLLFCLFVWGGGGGGGGGGGACSIILFICWLKFMANYSETK